MRLTNGSTAMRMRYGAAEAAAGAVVDRFNTPSHATGARLATAASAAAHSDRRPSRQPPSLPPTSVPSRDRWGRRSRGGTEVPGRDGGRDRGDKAVPLSRDGLHEARVVRRIAQGAADLQNAEVEAALEIHARVAAPDLSPELPAQDHFSGMGQQQREHARRLRRQFNDLALAAELAAAEVEIE